MVSVAYWNSVGGGAKETPEREAERMRYEHGAGASSMLDRRIKDALAAGELDKAKNLRAVWIALRG